MAPNLAELAESWHIHLQAERKSPQTRRTYMTGVRLYLDWCARHGHTPSVDRRLVELWLAELTSEHESTTVRGRQTALKQFSKWLADEGIIPRDPLAGMKPVKLDQKVVPVYEEDDLRALIGACRGKDFLDRRDEAALRLLAECGLRAHELLGLKLDDVNLRTGEVTVERGKGGRGRRLAIGPATARAMDRYLRARAQHRLSGLPQLWLGRAGVLTYFGLRKALLRRAEAAGITGARLHRLRHTFAARWLGKGGSEGGLMRAGGWSDRRMIDRYTQHQAERLALDEAKRLQLGDL